MSEKILCVVCPLGCKLLVNTEGESVSVEGNKCSKGIDFAYSEIVEPKRNLATSIPIDGQVLIHNVSNTGVDVIATRTVY